MKRFLICLFIVLVIFLSLKDEIKIPEESIRFRVLANSNSENDQKIKTKVKDDVQNQIFDIIGNEEDFSTVRNLLKNNLNNIENTVENTLANNNVQQNYKVQYGNNFFPQKNYKGIKYEQGNYESLLITLGNGQGDNWWCVLFPPFCLIEGKETNEVEYKWLVKEIIDKYL